MSERASVAVFSGYAGEYDAERRRLVPPYDAFYGAAAEVLRRLPAEPGRPLRVLDLGAGTGLLGAELRRVLPDVQLELLDGSAAMLDQARARFGDTLRAVHHADLVADPLPAGPYDAVVSALAIHHLSDPDKRALFARVHAVLRPGGVFVNAEQVSGPRPWLTAIYEAAWADACRAGGASESEIDLARERMRHDRCADVESQLRWIRAAGFAAADCVFKSWRFAVLAGWRESR